MLATDTIQICGEWKGAAFEDIDRQAAQWREGQVCLEAFAGGDACRVEITLPGSMPLNGDTYRDDDLDDSPYSSNDPLAGIDLILSPGTVEAFTRDILKLVREYAESGHVRS